MHELGTQILDAYLWCQILIVQIGDTPIKDMQKNYVIEIICICILYHPSNYASVDILLLALCEDAVVHKIMCKYYIYMYWCRLYMCIYVNTHMFAPLDIFSWDGLKVWQGSHTIMSAMFMLTSKYLGKKNVLSLCKENSQVSLANNVSQYLEQIILSFWITIALSIKSENWN
jgi:hypothetical protein